MTDDQTLLDLAGRATPRKPYAFHSLSACAGCGCSGDDFGSVNVEAFEMTGELYCDDCADEAIENASQGDGE